MADSFKRANLSNLYHISVAGSAFNKDNRKKATSSFEKYHSYMKTPYIHKYVLVQILFWVKILTPVYCYPIRKDTS